MSPGSWSRRFSRRRFGLRVCLVLGILLVLLPGSSAGDALPAAGGELLRFSGVALLMALLPLYQRYGNRCPRCRQSFSDAAEHAGPDTRGLPLLNAIMSCPFCGVELGNRTSGQACHSSGRSQGATQGQAVEAEPGAAADRGRM